MRKVFVVAAREYKAAVRTKSFLISLVVLPVMMGGSVVVQSLLKDVRDIREKHFAVIDRSGGKIAPLLKEAAEKREVKDPSGKQVKPVFVIEIVEPGPDTPVEMNKLRFELSERVRHKELFGFVEVLPSIYDLPTDATPSRPSPLRYQTNSPTYEAFPSWLTIEVNKAVQEYRTKNLMAPGVTVAQLTKALEPVTPVSKGLSKRNPTTGEIEEAPDENRLAAFLVPLGLMMLMFMMVLVGATPLMQGVVEEKMQRIAEVLLGSLQPFQLMMGKLLGMTGVSLTLAAIYLSAAYWAATRFGFSENITFEVLLWFVTFQILATMMFGSLFIAIGAACTDLRETQNLLWPVMLLAVFPMFLLAPVLTEPNSPFAVGASFVPFATPTLMIARQAIPPGIPVWQPALGVVIVLLTTLACVYAAGRIFRVGILLQGKGARFGDMLRWVIRG